MLISVFTVFVYVKEKKDIVQNFTGISHKLHFMLLSATL
jgi:hypothetical protein